MYQCFYSNYKEIIVIWDQELGFNTMDNHIVALKILNIFSIISLLIIYLNKKGLIYREQCKKIVR